MHSIVGVWRWRGNALRRGSDRREAWLALCTLLLILLGAPLVGWLCAEKTHATLLRAVHEQHRVRHQVWAAAESVAQRSPAGSDPDSSAPRARRRVIAQWTGPDGSSHTSSVGVDRHVQLGDRFRIWTGPRGGVAAEPLSVRTASSHALLAGVAAGAGAAGAVETLRRLTLAQSLRRRYARWEAEWQRIGPDWGRTGTSY